MPQGSASCGHNHTILWDELREVKETECSICLDTTKGKAVQHQECSLKACRECLVTWLSEHFSCPNCRRRLRTKCRCNMTVEEEVEEIHTHRRVRIQPTRYYVAESPPGIRCILDTYLPENEPFDFWKMIADEIEDTQLVMESEGIRNLKTMTVQELMQRKEELELDEDSVYRLWYAHRLMGARTFYLTQFPAYPHLGFWTPVLSSIHCLQSPDEVSRFVNGRGPVFLERLLAKSTVTQIPLSTAGFVNIFRACERMYPDESQVEVRDIYEAAERAGFTHWALFDLSGSRPDSNFPQYDHSLWVVPFPQEKMSQGFRNLEFPGIPRLGTIQTTGWDEKYDQSNLAELVRIWQNEKSMDFDAHAIRYYGEVPIYIPNGSEVDHEEFGASVELDYA